MPSETPLWSSVEEALTRQVWFSDRTTRTPSRLVKWLRELHDSPTGIGSELRTEIELAFGGGLAPEELERAMRSVASDLLRRLCVGDTHIDDLPSAADAILESLDAADDGPHGLLATETTVERLLRTHHGGAELLEHVTPGEVIEHLALDARFDEFLGHPALRRFLADPTIPEAGLRPAATLLTQPHFWAQHLLLPAVRAATPSPETARRRDLVRQLDRDGVTVPDRPLLLPPPQALRRAVGAFIADHGDAMPAEMRAAAVAATPVLAPTRYWTRASYVGPMEEVRATVLAVLAEATGCVLSEHYDTRPQLRERNWERLSALASAPISSIELHRYPALKRLVRVPSGVRTPRRSSTRTHVVPASKLKTMYDVHALICDHVADTGCLPARDELDDADLSALERIVACRYQDYAKALHAQDPSRFPSPRRSANERALDSLLADAFGSAIVEGSFCNEWSDRETFGTLSRIDTYLRLEAGLFGSRAVEAVELFAEADGEGHFVQVPNFTPLEQYRRADVDKAVALHRRWTAANDLIMVNLHHRLLTGPANLRLSADELRSVVVEARKAGHWWLFLRPAGLQECRAVPGDAVEVFAVDGCTAEVLVPADPAFRVTQTQLALC